MKADSPLVSVVIPTAGTRRGLLRRSVERLLEDSATGEVIIALDASAEADVDLTELGGERVRVARVETQAGSSTTNRGQGARDHGVKAAHCDLVLTLDDDVEPSKGLVSAHSEVHAGLDRRLVLGYMPVAPPRANEAGSVAAARLYSESYERACSVFRRDSESVLLGLWGGHFSVHRNDWMRAALERAPGGYHVDLEFGLRLRATGVRGIFAPELRASHWYRRSLEEFAADARTAGSGLAALHRAYPDLVQLPQRRRALLPLLNVCRWTNTWSFFSRSLVLAGRTAASAHLSRLEYGCAKLIWQIGLERGLREQHATEATATAS